MPRTAACTLVLLALLALLAGCVTERVVKTPREQAAGAGPVGGKAAGPASTGGKTATSTPPGASAPADLPPPSPAAASATPGAAPVASPADTAETRSGRVLLAIRPAGFVEYDGLTLPLVAPNGEFIAVSSGQSPPWPALLAAPDAVAPNQTFITVYDISQPNPRRVAWREPVVGFVLGRSAGPDGFLVESPRPDGSRWIGKVDWRTGEVRWLVQGSDVSSHAIQLRDGTLVWSRRPKSEPFCRLVVRTPQGAERELAESGRSLLMPLASPDQAVVAAMSVGPEQLDLVVVPLATQAAEGQNLRVSSRLQVDRAGSPLSAFQAVAGIDAAPHQLGAVPDTLRPRLAGSVLFVNPRMGRICLFEPGSAAESPLPSGIAAAAAVATNSGVGLLATGPKGLELIGVRMGRNAAGKPGLEVGSAMTGLNGPYVARSTSVPDRFVLIGPAGGPDDRRLQVVSLQTLDAPPTGSAAPGQ